MPGREEPIQSYYPSARVRFILRFEDWGRVTTASAPVKPPHLRKGKSDVSTVQLQVVEQPDGSFQLVQPGGDPNSMGSPQEQRSSSDSKTWVVDGIIPLTADPKFNGIRTADTLSLEVAYRDFPFDPRAIRACAVEYFEGCITPEDYQRGINGEIRADATPAGGLPYHVVPDEYVDPYGRRRTNLRFSGWVDEWDDEWPSEDAPTVRFECVDNTFLLLNQDAPQKLVLDPALPIDKAIATYLANFPQMRGMSVTYLPRVTRDKVPVLKAVLLATKFQPKLGPSPSTGGSGKLKVWDYLTDVCRAIGHSVRVDGNSIIVQTPRSLYDNRLPARAEDPFSGRRLPGGRVLTRRLYLYGRNIWEMGSKRRFGTYQPKNVEVRCYQTDRKTTLVARFPETKEDRLAHPAPGDATEQKWSVFTVEGIGDQKTLKLVAQSYYETMGRNELSVRVQTSNLGSYGGGNLDPDALDLRPGDAVDVELMRDPSEEGISTTAGEVTRSLDQGAADYLRSLGFGAALADAYQAAVSGIGLQSTFRVKTLQHAWDGSGDSQLGLTLDLCNYVEVRVDKPSTDDTTSNDLADATNTQQPVDVIVEDSVAT